MSGKNLEVINKKKSQALSDISEKFGVVTTVQKLQYMMQQVTKDEFSVDSVNAACNCVQNINLTIKTAIQAAKFLADERE